MSGGSIHRGQTERQGTDRHCERTPIASVQDRVAGAMDIFSKNPDIKILSQDQNAAGSRDGGLRVMTDLLTANPKLDAVFAINDPTALGCDLAAKQANRSEFLYRRCGRFSRWSRGAEEQRQLVRSHSGPGSLRHGAKGRGSWLRYHEGQEPGE